jgi:ABC-type glycerol-3-phosphate transport system substrate-binding protein
MMLMMQSGVQMTSQDGTNATFSRSVEGTNVGERALTFYTDFANPQRAVYTWNDAMDYSIDAFTAGKTAMMLNYSHQIPVIRAAAPRLNWAVAPAPQVSSVDVRTYASYWPLVVALQSDAPNAAWQFVHYMTAGDGTVSYLNAAGRPAARRDLIEQQKNDPYLGVFAEQALAARSWLQVDNVAIETIFADMIDNVNLGRQALVEALKAAEAKVSVLMGGR